MNELYLPLDTETGGFGDKVSLLTAHFAVCTKDLSIIDELSLSMKPNDGEYVVTAGALRVNKINLIEHEQIALPYSQAGQQLREFLWKYSHNGEIKLVPVGKNITFDIEKINANLLGKKTWEQFVSYRTYDITSVVIHLKRKGLLPSDAPESLEKLAKYFNIPHEAHTASGDTIASIEVVKRLEAL